MAVWADIGSLPLTGSTACVCVKAWSVEPAHRMLKTPNKRCVCPSCNVAMGFVVAPAVASGWPKPTHMLGRTDGRTDSGRTARMGANGRVTSLLAKRDLVLAAAIEQVGEKLRLGAAATTAGSKIHLFALTRRSYLFDVEAFLNDDVQSAVILLLRPRSASPDWAAGGRCALDQALNPRPLNRETTSTRLVLR